MQNFLSDSSKTNDLFILLNKKRNRPNRGDANTDTDITETVSSSPLCIDTCIICKLSYQMENTDNSRSFNKCKKCRLEETTYIKYCDFCNFQLHECDFKYCPNCNQESQTGSRARCLNCLRYFCYEPINDIKNVDICYGCWLNGNNSTTEI